MAISESQGAVHLLLPAEPSSLPVRITVLADNDAPAWDLFVSSQPHGTFFHRLGWKRVMEKTYGYKPYYFCAKRGERITGIAPSFLISNWMMGRCLISLPFAVYGGICAEDQQSEQALIAHLEGLASDLDVAYLELRNRTGDLRSGYHRNPRYSTFTLSLVPDTEAIYKAFPKDIRYMLRKAEKAALRAQRGSEQLDVFYELMTINLRRLGTPAFPKQLFENLISEYPGQVDLTVVYSGDQPVCGGMSFFFREWMQPYYIGSKEEAKALAANNFLWWELMKLGATTGHSIFDFGRSKKNSGNYDFKKKWNPQIEDLSYQVRLVRRKEAPDFSPMNPKFEAATNLWKKMPLGLTRALGPHVVRWFP
jgi:FemAB-related protein (PEP-CTERM system-associated)